MLQVIPVLAGQQLNTEIFLLLGIYDISGMISFISRGYYRHLKSTVIEFT